MTRKGSSWTRRTATTLSLAGVLLGVMSTAACNPLPYGCHEVGHGLVRCYKQGGGPS